MLLDERLKLCRGRLRLIDLLSVSHKNTAPLVSTGWPGMGIRSTTPVDSANGNICLSFSAAVGAFSLSFPQSSKSNKHWRTGFE